SILKEGIHHILEVSHLTHENILGIGVAMHGVVEVETGTSLIAPNLNLTDIPIKDEIEKAFGLLVKVENDARAMALGEYWFGGHGDFDSMAVVNVGGGVGAGVVIEGKLYHCAQDLAGELGHMAIDLHGVVCTCGNRGCLQTFATGTAIADRAGKTINDHTYTLTGEEVYLQAQSGNEAYMKILQETGEIIGIGLTNFIHMMNPRKIVLGSGVMKSEKILLPIIKQTIDQRVLTPAARQTEVVVTKLG